MAATVLNSAHHVATASGPVASTPLLSGLNQTGAVWVVDVFGDRTILDELNGFVNDESWYEEPFARDDRIAQAVLNFNIEPRWGKNAVDDAFQPGSVDVG